MKKILIIEDDKVICSEIKKALESWNFSACTINDFSNVLNEFKAFMPELVLLDISLPFKNGYYICSEIRKLSKVPIIFISSACENMNIVMAMNIGADDYITKPFDTEVLIAKINALIRRAYDFNSESSVISLKNTSLDLLNASFSFEGKVVELTKNEFVILKTLMRSHTKIVSRDEIMTKLWDSEAFIDDNTLTVNMTRLRKKLSTLGLSDFIGTRKNLGYIIND